MRQRNDGQGEVNTLQNRFTAYLLTALKRKKRDYTSRQSRLSGHEFPVDFQTIQFPEDTAGTTEEETPEEDAALMQALAHLTARERYILFEHILNERSYDALAAPLDLQYSGVSAAYRRIIQKLRKELGGHR